MKKKGKRHNFRQRCNCLACRRGAFMVWKQTGYLPARPARSKPKEKKEVDAFTAELIGAIDDADKRNRQGGAFLTWQRTGYLPAALLSPEEKKQVAAFRARFVTNADKRKQ